VHGQRVDVRAWGDEWDWGYDRKLTRYQSMKRLFYKKTPKSTKTCSVLKVQSYWGTVQCFNKRCFNNVLINDLVCIN